VFTQPKMIEAFTKLAAVVPPVADAMATLAEMLTSMQQNLLGPQILSGIGGKLQTFSSSLGGAEPTVRAFGGALKALGLGGAVDDGKGVYGVPGSTPAGIEDPNQGILADQIATGEVKPQLGADGKYRMLKPTAENDDGTFQYEMKELNKSDVKLNDRGGLDWDAMTTTMDGGGRTFKTNRLDKEESFYMQAQDASKDFGERRKRRNSKDPMADIREEWDLGGIGKLMSKPEKPAAGPAASGPKGVQEVKGELKTPELIGLLSRGIMVSLDAGSADAIGRAVSGKSPMPSFKPRTGIQEPGE